MMKDDTFWNVLKHVTRSLETNKKDNKEGEQFEGRSHGETALVTVNREMMQNMPLPDETMEEVAESNELEQMAWFSRLEEEDAAFDNSDDKDNEDMNDTGRSNSRINIPNEEPTLPNGEQTSNQIVSHIVTAETETLVTIGTSNKKTKVRKAKYN